MFNSRHQIIKKLIVILPAILGAIIIPVNTTSAVSLDTSNYLPDGRYTFESISGLLAEFNQSNVSIKHVPAEKYDANKYEAYLRRGNDGYYTITSVSTGKSVDVNGASSANGANIQMWEPNGTCAQKWAIQHISESTYRLRNACSGKAMDINGAATWRSGTNVQLWDNNNTNAQKWHLTRMDGYDSATSGWRHSIKTISGTSLDVFGGIFTSGTNIQVWHNNNTNAQKFQLVHYSDGSFNIHSMGNNKSIDVAGAAKHNGANVWLWESNDTCAQKWFAEKSGNARILRNSCSGKALDVNGAITWLNGTNVQIWDNNHTNAQKWYFSKI